MTDQPIIDDHLKDDVVRLDGIPVEDEASFHTILEAWMAILTPALEERRSQITPQWASRICGKYQQMTFNRMPTFRTKYFDRVEEMLALLSAEIETDPECLKRLTPEEDAEHNSEHYINILTDWQIAVLRWELEWDCTHPQAAEDLAAIAEVHQMFFGEVGMTALLDQINFQFTDMHRDALSLALQGFKDEWEG